jgi:hypothetical protein
MAATSRFTCGACKVGDDGQIVGGRSARTMTGRTDPTDSLTRGAAAEDQKAAFPDVGELQPKRNQNRVTE